MRVQELQRIIGGHLKRLRHAKGWSQARLAKEAGVSADFLSRAERGLRAPSTASLCRLAEALGVPPAELMAAGPSMDGAIRPVPDLALVLRDRPERHVRLIAELARLVLDELPLPVGRTGGRSNRRPETLAPKRGASPRGTRASRPRPRAG